jgi:ferrous iron transport protein B
MSDTTLPFEKSRQTSTSSHTRTSSKKLTVALAGNPNVGKSTLFNSLTGSNQKIANFPGVTVERKAGQSTSPEGHQYKIIDLPGTYSLKPQSTDEKIASHHIIGIADEKCDVIAVIVEAKQLARGLLLFKQVQSVHPQCFLVLNMVDEIEKRNLSVDTTELSKELQVPVVSLIAKTEKGLDDFYKTLNQFESLPQNSSKNLIEDEVHVRAPELIFPEIDALTARVLKPIPKPRKPLPKNSNENLDKFLLHPVFGPLAFILVIYFIFTSLFTWSGPLVDLIDSGLGFLSDLTVATIPEGLFQSLIVDGIIGGVGAFVVFVPQIALTFLFIGFLEMSGYLARGGFLIDRLMRAVGLEGRAFIPLISSFACALPGIAATRSLPNARQRLITILIAPLMTCSARLPVYTLLIASFIPASAHIGPFHAQGFTLFGLFALGIVAGMVVSFVANKLLPEAHQHQFLMELPPYRLPKWRTLWFYVWFRTKSFLITAGTTIFFLSLVLWAMATFPRSTEMAPTFENQRQEVLLQDTFNDDQKSVEIEKIDHREAGYALRHSALGQIGIAMEPLWAPMGFDWKLGIASLSSFAAREVFVSTLGVVMNLGETDEESSSLRELLQNAKNPDGTNTYTLATALSLLVFFALACQCLSTLAVIKKETSSNKWPAITFIYMSVLAYGLATITYHVTNLFL